MQQLPCYCHGENTRITVHCTEVQYAPPARSGPECFVAITRWVFLGACHACWLHITWNFHYVLLLLRLVRCFSFPPIPPFLFQNIPFFFLFVLLKISYGFSYRDGFKVRAATWRLHHSHIGNCIGATSGAGLLFPGIWHAGYCWMCVSIGTMRLLCRYQLSGYLLIVFPIHLS